VNLIRFRNSYLHIQLTSISTTQEFDIILRESSAECDSFSRFATWEQVSGSWCRTGSDIYIPIRHFPIHLERASTLVFGNFRELTPVEMASVRIVNTVPHSISLPERAAQAPLVFTCKNPIH
jgi:hypothetical protein